MPMYTVEPGGGMHVAPSTDDPSEHLVFEGSPLLSADTVRLPPQLGGRIVCILSRDTTCACGGGHVAAVLDASVQDKQVCVSDCGEFMWFTRRGGE